MQRKSRAKGSAVVTHRKREKLVVSQVMARIRKTNTGPELKLRHALWRSGLRGYRLFRRLPGLPDISFGPARVAVFVDGCFWHCCPECKIRVPRKPYWKRKIAGNVARDRRVTAELRARGWYVLRLWEHEVRAGSDRCAARITTVLSRRAPKA